MNAERMACEKTVYQIAVWLREQMDGALAKGYVVGLSGGVDSAVAAALAVKAVGKDRVQAYYLSCGSAVEEYAIARKGAGALGLDLPHIDLTPHWQLLVGTLMGNDPNIAKPPVPTMGNLKARLRMATLYYFANSDNLLVLGTSNKDELEMGYFTKYGDGGVDVEPLGDLHKRHVYKLAEALGVPQVVIDRPPSAGLWAGQTDEADMGVTYKEIESFVSGSYSAHLPADKRIKMDGMRSRSEHKRRMPPIWREA